MPQIGSVIGDLIETGREQGGNIVKEVVSETAKSFNILEGIAPVDPVKVEQMQAKEASVKKSKLSALHQEVQSMKAGPPQPTEEQRIQQGAEMAEKGQANQAGQMNNQLSSSMTPKKKMEPLALTQKRKDKAPAGAG